MLSVNDHRRSRSKSPSGRDRDRSRSRDTRDIGRDRSPGPAATHKERRSSRYDENDDSEEGSYDERQYKEKRRKKGSSWKSAANSRRYDEEDNDSELSDRRRSSRSRKSQRRGASVSDDDKRRDKSSRKVKKRVDDSDVDNRPGKAKSRKEPSSRKKIISKDDNSDSNSEESDDHRPRKAERQKSKYDDNNGAATNGPPPSSYGQPVYAYASAPPPSSARYQETRHMSYVGGDPRYAPPPTDYMQPLPVKQRPGSFSGPAGYAKLEQFRYDQVDRPVYTYESQRHRDLRYPEERERRRPEKLDDGRKEKRYNDDNYEVRKPRRDREYNDDTDASRDKEKKYNDDRYGSRVNDVSRRLSNATAPLGRGPPPASPLLESYKGTYQSISPMPGALVLHQHKHDSDVSDFDMASDNDDGIDPNDPNADLKRKIKRLENEKVEYQKQRERSNGKDEEARAQRGSVAGEVKPRDAENGDSMRSRESKNKAEVQYEIRAPRGARDDDDSDGSPSSPPSSRRVEKKRVMFYEADTDAKKIASALEGTNRPASVKPLIAILPGLSDDDVMALRLAYKNIAKVGGQGINIAKHIKMRVPGNLGKACYATALGRWESEAYWANSWYQGGSTRRELLIESLMGRSNSDIREIKNCFKDKRYGNDLEQCMKAELKADKFRAAILLALQERRMPESTPLSKSLVNDDVVNLHRAITSPGGESALIQTIVVRSDQHLRAFLRVFEATYHVNFARSMIEKSRNLVGETLAHILNGALNRPMRDAMLLHQAIAETAPGRERAELLISRLVRLHWEPKHLERVKAQYKARYGRSVEADIMKEIYANMKTNEGRQWAEFCVELVRSSA
ncbi:hypothetical protein DV736_g5698, partial [Chaetothyriales sp. CBS 134916]